MSKIISLILGVLITFLSVAQSAESKPRILYGTITADSLAIAPFNKWFTAGYDAYKPDSVTAAQLSMHNFRNYNIQVFFGTWCGDSKREVPRLMKVANAIGLAAGKIKLVTVGDSDSLYKQSPQHEEQGMGIFRVPTIIVYKNGIEINRINEFPVNSIEKDLLSILKGDGYVPNYHSFGVIKNWLNDGTLLDENISGRSIAGQLKWLVNNENELNSLGYVLLLQNRKKEALKIFQANYSLFPESANVISSLGEGYLKNADGKNAVAYLERSLEENKDPKAVKDILALLYEAKGVK